MGDQKSKLKVFIDMPFCNDDGMAWDRLPKPVRKFYKKIATGRMCKKSIAQLVEHSQFGWKPEDAFLAAFKQPIDNVTDEEYIIVEFCFKSGEAEYIQKIKKRTLVDEKFANNFKVLAQSLGVLGEDNVGERTIPALNVNLGGSGKKPPKREFKDNKMEPLKLVQNG